MMLTVKVDGDPARELALTVGRLRTAVTAAVSSATADVDSAWRRDLASSLGPKLGKAVRATVYPQGRDSLNAAGVVNVGRRAERIIATHENGALIRSSGGLWLAIPLVHGPRGFRITPREWEKRNGRRLRFVPRKTGAALLVDDGTPIDGAEVRRKVKGEYKMAAPRRFRNRTIPIFTLVPQVKIPKSLNLAGSAGAIGATLGARVRTQIGAAL